MVTANVAALRTMAGSPPTSSPSSSEGPEARSVSNTASSWRPKSSGSTRFTTTADSCTVVSSRTRSASSMVSFTGISSGVHTAARPVWLGSERICSIQSVCERMRPTFTNSLMACGAASCPMMCPAAGASTTTRS